MTKPSAFIDESGVLDAPNSVQPVFALGWSFVVSKHP